MHAPAAVDELPSALLDQVAHVRLGCVGLLSPPSLEEGLLDVDELAVGVALEGGECGCDEIVDGGLLERVVAADEVLVHSLQPADVIVGVGHEVDGERRDVREEAQQTQAQAECTERLHGVNGRCGKEGVQRRNEVVTAS